MGSKQAIETRRAAAVDELRAALAELESGEGLMRLVGGHGIQSRVFEFAWDEPTLEISFRIPYGRVLSDEATQKEDVKALDFDAVNGPAANAESLRYALDRAAELPVEFGNEG